MPSIRLPQSASEALAARRERRAGLGFALPAALWIVAFFAAPVVLMAIVSLRPLGTEGFSTGAYRAFFANAAYLRAVWNSVVTTAIVVAVSTLLAYPFAWVIANRVPKHWQRLALSVAIVPFWTSYVVRSYAWLLALSPSGVVNWALVSLGLTDRPLMLAYNPGATVLGFVHFFVMLNTLTIYANLVQIDPRYALAAQDLGASRWRAFAFVTLPLSVPGIAVGAFLTIVLCIGDFVTPQILGGLKELLLPQLVMMQIQRQLDLPMASAMSLVMTVIVALAYLALHRWLRTQKM